MDEEKSKKDEPKKRPRGRAGSKWALYGASILLVIVSLFGAYYFLYISDRSVLLDQYYLRLLSNSASNVQTIVEGRRINVDNAVKNFRSDLSGVMEADLRAGQPEGPDHAEEDIEEVARQRAMLDVTDRDIPTHLPDAVDYLGDQLTEKLGLIDAVEVSEPFDSQKAGLYTVVENEPYGADERREPKVRALSLRREATELGYEIESILGRHDSDAVIEYRPKLLQDDKPYALATARGDLKQMLEPALPDEVFSAVLLAREDGMVLFQTGRGQYRLRDLPRTSKRNSKTGELLEDPAPSSRTHIREVDLAGVRYKLFVQPFRVPIALTSELERDDEAGSDLQRTSTEGDDDAGAVPLTGGELEHYWVLAALMPVADLRTEAMVISTNLLLIVVGLFVAGVLSLPFLKIRYLGHREALRSQDVTVLAVAILVGTSLYTYAIVDSFAYRGLEATRGDQLSNLARGIETRVLGELDQAARQIESLTETRYAGTEPISLAKNLLEAHDENPLRAEELRVAYPYFRMAFWLDETGWQVGKWSTSDSITSRISVSSRDYFQRPNAGDVWTLPPRPMNEAEFAEWLAEQPRDRKTAGSFVQSIRSKTTGDVSAVLSRRIVSPDSRDGARVAALETYLLSLIDPVLPAGFGFAVFDDDGKVLFHSAKERNLHEDFLEEIQDDEVLRAAVFSGTEARVATTYRTRPLDVFVTPMNSLPWNLAVFANADRLRTQHLETLTFALLLFSLYLTVVLVFGLWLRYSDRVAPSPGAVRSNWFWPDPVKLFAYAILTVAMIVLAICWVGDTVFGNPIHDLERTLLVAVAGMAMIHWVLRTHHVAHKRRQGWTTSIFYAAVAVAVGVLFGVMEIQDRVVSAARGEGSGLTFLGDAVLIAAAIVVIALRRAGPLLGLLIAVAVGMVTRDSSSTDWTGYGVALVLVLLLAVPWPLLRERTEEFLLRRGAGWKEMYVLCAFSVMVVLGVLPAITFYRAIHNDVAFLVAKHDQIEFADALQVRANKLAGLHAGQAWTEPEDTGSEEARKKGEERNAELNRTNLGEQHYVYARPTYAWMSAFEVRDFSLDHYKPAKERRLPEGTDWSRQRLVEQLRDYLPQYNESTYRLRDLVFRTASAGPVATRKWTVSSPDDPLERKRLTMFQTEYAPAVGGTVGRRTALELATPVETLDREFLERSTERDGKGMLAWAVLGLLALAILWLILRASVRRVFLLDLIQPRILRKALGQGGRAGARTLVLQPDEETERKLTDESTCWTIGSQDIREAESVSTLVEAAVASGLPTIVVQRFDDGLDEPALALKKLQLLEELEQVGRQNVVVSSAADPLHYFTARATDSLASTLILDVDRWAVALEPFEKVRGDASKLSSLERRQKYQEYLKSIVPAMPQEDAEVLAAECWTSPYQRALGKRIAPRMGDLNREQIVDLVLDHSEAYYRRLWSSCSTEERLLLHRLAQEGFVNWQMKEALRRMLQRGLVVAGPAYRLMNESFRRFVLRAESPSVFASWESRGDAGLFARLKVPLITALVVIAGFFFATQRESFNHTLGIVTAMATSGPLLVKLMATAAQARQRS